MWNEWAATELDMVLANYAFGGVTSSNKFAPGPVPNIQEQISMFALQSGLERFATPDNDIAVVEIGTNDIFKGYDDNAFENSTAINEFANQITMSIDNVLDKMVSYVFKNFYSVH
ncbi:hypothetical protein J3B02_003288 [Coemansia erecta]|nr:hypothetical protein J3B02_003288 [Coemansia erecta]